MAWITPPPECWPQPQHMAALEKANAVRFARAELKRDVAAGRVTIEAALVDWSVETLPIGELLVAQHGWGHKRVRRFMNDVRVSEFVRCGALTVRQMGVVLDALADEPKRYEKKAGKP